MEIKKVNNQRITRAESICLSGHFIISCCGQSVSIFDKDLNLIIVKIIMS